MTTLTVLNLESVETHLVSLIQAWDLTIAAIVECPCRITPDLCGLCRQREQALDTFETEFERVAQYAPNEVIGRAVLATRGNCRITWE